LRDIPKKNNTRQDDSLLLKLFLAAIEHSLVAIPHEGIYNEISYSQDNSQRKEQTFLEAEILENSRHRVGEK